MKLLWIPFLIWIVVDALLVDPYIWWALRRRCRHLWPAKLQALTALLFTAMGVIMLLQDPAETSPQGFLAFMWLMFVYLTVYVPKILWTVVDLLSRLPLLWHRRPWRWLSLAGTVAAVAAFCVMWGGATVGRYGLEVKEVTVDIPDLPPAFDGYRIAQLSDMHVGTYGTDTSYVSRVVDRVNGLRPDVVMFTGDIVNRVPDELPPFLPPLSRLTAPDGVIAIPGNHDHLDYSGIVSWRTRHDTFDRFMAVWRDTLGWDVLLDDHRRLRRGGDSLTVIGVQNMGEDPFPHYGSLRRAYPDLSDSTVKILLTHNPRHWTDSVMPDTAARIALTLSGHTHAMQMRLGSHSPAALRYPTWQGLHASPDGRRQLYVNIGTGTVGIPMRIGATPEITLITLRRAPMNP